MTQTGLLYKGMIFLDKSKRNSRPTKKKIIVYHQIHSGWTLFFFRGSSKVLGFRNTKTRKCSMWNSETVYWTELVLKIRKEGGLA